MDGHRLSAIAAVLAATDEGPAVARLLDVAVELLPISGASVAVVDGRQHLGSLAASGTRAVAIDELQFTLGEGPCRAAAAAGRAILEPDLLAAVDLWPAFAPAAAALGACAVFAFPLQVGPVILGVLSLYAAEPGDLVPADLADALAVARIATHLLLELERGLPPGFLPERLEDVTQQRAVVHQATGMVAAQLGVDVAAALGRLRAHAWALDLSVGRVAEDVVARRLRFDGA